ncbi:hypothetical protein dqs_0292 [Azoarcus olearius]|uniref:DUF3348 domain-containing protein n=1 Tax=Azoarcus sp. (strain BH72) TaxID=418699 RepID=UPI0008062E82|nr:DUF3348 domain-containing protein [Azoarcus olearius]ANQ83369.1 hypothetical protein dqs_0292 [Azoarcus olearius]
MAQGLPRTRFNTSALQRALAGLVVEEPGESRQPFAERLGQWLDFKDALALFSVLDARPGEAATAAAAASPLGAELARVRSTLVQAIGADGASAPGVGRIAAPLPPLDGGPEALADFAPYQRYCLARQRDMQATIATLRGDARAALARHSAALARLAALDAVLEQGLAVRERALLATIPALLAQRFEQLLAAHRAAQPAGTADDPAGWSRPGGWLATFRADLRTVLLAELALRLQPVSGLVEALEGAPAVGA